MKHTLVPMWNPVYDLIKSNPVKDKHFASVNGTRSRIEKAIAEKKPEAEIAALREELAKHMAEAAKFDGPVEIYHPDRDPKSARVCLWTGSKWTGPTRRRICPRRRRKSPKSSSRRSRVPATAAKG
ncbi:MAG: hypothetical protein R3F31_11755 [Verrucomicrobiales bacterium]